jgi:hypothetical protein
MSKKSEVPWTIAQINAMRIGLRLRYLQAGMRKEAAREKMREHIKEVRKMKMSQLRITLEETKVAFETDWRFPPTSR